MWPTIGILPPALLEAAGFNSPVGRARAGARSTSLEGVREPQASNPAEKAPLTAFHT